MEDGTFRPYAQAPDPNATCMAEAEALAKARAEHTDAPACAVLVRYHDAAAAHPQLAAASSAVVHPDRLVWVVTVHADVMTPGGPAIPPELKHVYSLVIDAETGGVPDFGFGDEAVQDGQLVVVPRQRGAALPFDPLASPPPPAGAYVAATLYDYPRFLAAQGNAAGADLTHRFISRARDVVTRHKGWVIVTGSDTVVAALDAPDPALRAALEMRQLRTVLPGEDPSVPLGVGVGLEVGAAVPVEGTYVGLAVTLVTRLSARAGPGNVLVGPTMHAEIVTIPGIDLVDHGEVVLPGFPEPVRTWSAVSA